MTCNIPHWIPILPLPTSVKDLIRETTDKKNINDLKSNLLAGESIISDRIEKRVQFLVGTILYGANKHSKGCCLKQHRFSEWHSMPISKLINTNNQDDFLVLSTTSIQLLTLSLAPYFSEIKVSRKDFMSADVELIYPGLFDVKVIRPTCISVGWPSHIEMPTKTPRNELSFNPEKILQQFWEAAKSANGTDVVFKDSHNEELHAHTWILKARCEYFQTLWESNFKEANEENHSISIDNINSMKQFLEFVYTGKVNWDSLETSDAFCLLIDLADFYICKDLISLCESKLGEVIQQGNIEESEKFSLQEQFYRCKKIVSQYAPAEVEVEQEKFTE